jgi:16S rRNA (cytosine1402-N4)-methyltransferase
MLTQATPLEAVTLTPGSSSCGFAQSRRLGGGLADVIAFRQRGEAGVSHVPVLLAEVLEALKLRPGGLYLDGTFGAGGYARALLEKGARVVALDRDPRAIDGGAALAAEFPERLRLLEARFGELDRQARDLDGVALDIGVSSMQLDQAERGFSLRFDAPLDMRMGGEGRTAADILAEASEAELADIFFHYGEERAARRIARAIAADREAAPFVSTQQLAGLVARVAPAPPAERTHPATRVFQALRIAVNDELGELARGLAAAERALKPGGRLAVVTFHSLEDRIVKQFLARRSGRGRAVSRLLPGEPVPPAPSWRAFPGQPIAPGAAELSANPRARSAKLRFAERTDAPAFADDSPAGER